ncbi:hypothetical protein GCM10017044_19740 [Kordiimonas sediminis]|uniref:Peptidase S24/S26A/S26B/S26C domain-containing protein n=1 Tax=Kordiimonas sediminis TaxID=1735581 RepID=A0A919E921_9PROT|nr:S24 family peptidase [Kordiimonas sediminis]GHF25017.1 hypothetical protein GCM10017044_19740 [Kordiimonas sediminis]
MQQQSHMNSSLLKNSGHDYSVLSRESFSLGFSKDKSLPILGRAAGGIGNAIVEETPIDWTYRPPSLATARDAFAVYVTGSSMEPKYRPGDLVYIDPRKKLIPGRYVLVETSDHAGLIKEYVGWHNNMLILKQLNPASELSFPRQNVRNIMLIIGSMDS